MEHPGPLPQRRESNLTGMRRNSFSLPMINQENLEALQALHMQALANNDSDQDDSDKVCT